MATQRTLLDSWMPQAKQRKSDTPCSSQALSSSGGQEMCCASTASDEEIGGLSSEMNSKPLTTETGPTKCNAECCKDEGIDKPFQTLSNKEMSRE